MSGRLGGGWTRREALRSIGGAIARAGTALAAVRVTALLGASALGGGSLLSGCRRGAPRDDGRLVVYAAGPRKLAEALVALHRESTGRRVDLFTATTGQILAKVEAERLNPRADVLLLASSLAAEWLRREGRLLELEVDHSFASRPARPVWDDSNDFYAATGAACVGIAAARGWTRGVHSWESMLDGGFVNDEGRAGRVVMPSPARSGTSGDFVVQWTLAEGERAWSLFTGARRRGSFEVKGANSEAIGSLRQGESQAVLAAVDYLIGDAISRGDSISFSFPLSGAPVVTRPACILRSTRRPDAARAFVTMMLSPEAQRLVAQANLLPVDARVPLSPVRAAFGVPAPMPLDLDRAIAEQRVILRRFQYEVERLVVSA